MAGCESTQSVRSFQDITGQLFGKLTVLRRMPSIGGRVRWLCLCECGNEKTIRIDHLKSGNTKSCGCQDVETKRARWTKHGRRESASYGTWCKMVERCCNTQSEAYKYYGGRGISVCDRWRESFAAFLEDMGERPEGFTIDRIDNNAGYFPGNCRWATHSQQMANTRKNLYVTVWGETKHVSAWLRDSRCVVSDKTLRARLRAGWDAGQAIGTAGRSPGCLPPKQGGLFDV